MKNLLFVLVLSLLAASCKNENTDKIQEVETEEVAMNYQSFGDKITDDEISPNSEIIEKLKKMNVSDTLDVKLNVMVKDVCQKKGCWMTVDIAGEEAMVKFKDYAFFMPKDIAGQNVIMKGKAYYEETSVEDQRHFAEDAGETPEAIAAITEPKKTLTFLSTGVLIPAKENQ